MKKYRDKSRLKTKNKNWDQYTSKEKNEVYAVWATFIGFIFFWFTTDFRSAVALILLGYTVYFVIRAFRRINPKASLLAGVSLFVAALIVIPSATTEQNQNAQPVQVQNQEKALQDKEESDRLKKLEQEKPEIKADKKVESVQFETVEQEDPSIPKGQKKVSTQGVNGEITKHYEVTYVNGVEKSRKETKNEVSKAPVNQVVLVGTYTPPPAPTHSSGGSGYINSRGNYVPSPSSDPAGATAKCRDGTYSYSQSRRGTCSHHGGVASWL